MLVATKGVLDNPKMASWMRQCGAALRDYVGTVGRPLAPVGAPHGAARGWS